MIEDTNGICRFNKKLIIKLNKKEKFIFQNLVKIMVKNFIKAKNVALKNNSK